VKSSAARPRAIRLAGLTLTGAAVLVLLTGCSVEGIGNAFGHFGWPSRGISLQSHRMYDLWIAASIAALVVGCFVWGLIFWCIIRYRKRGGEDLPVQTRFNLPIEMIYTIIPFLVISVLFYYTAVVQTDVNKLTPNPDLVVNVEPAKWNWRFTYPATKGPDGREVSTIGTAEYVPVLVVPINKRIRFVEHSADVVHSFWVPDMLFKRDVFPGNVVNQFETTILSPGAYVGRCAELCGIYHSAMNFEVRALNPDRFGKYLTLRQTKNPKTGAGYSAAEALTELGSTDSSCGNLCSPLATTTQPFDTRRNSSR